MSHDSEYVRDDFRAWVHGASIQIKAVTADGDLLDLGTDTFKVDSRALLDANRFRRLTLDNGGPARKSQDAFRRTHTIDCRRGRRHARHATREGRVKSDGVTCSVVVLRCLAVDALRVQQLQVHVRSAQRRGHRRQDRLEHGLPIKRRLRELSARQDLLGDERVRLHDECRLPDG
jgi:hypothetical protein